MTNGEPQTATKPLLDFDRVPAFVSLTVCVLAAAAIFVAFRQFSVSDFVLHVKPWLDHIRGNGRIASLGDDFSEYAPPYVYLLVIATYAPFQVGDQTLVKLVNAPFVILIGYAVFRICRRFGKSVNVSAAAAGGVLVLPTLEINAFVWGQADTIYSPFLLLTVLLVIARRPYWAIASFALAVSIKLQGVFLAPFVAFAVLAGRIPVLALLVAPLVYALTLLPAALFGRPVMDLLKVYLVQGLYYSKLSMNAPNPYFWLDHVFDASADRRVYKVITLLGIALSACVGALVALAGFARRRVTDRALLLAATLSVTVMPYVLPKMHDRFFFGADLFAYVLAWVDRRFLWAAVAMQLSSAMSYGPEFSNFVLPGSYQAWGWAVVAGAAINLAVVFGLVSALRRELGSFIDAPRVWRRLRALLRWSWRGGAPVCFALLLGWSGGRTRAAG